MNEWRQPAPQGVRGYDSAPRPATPPGVPPVVPWSGRSAWRIALAIGLLWIIAGPAANRADAMGCHVPDRPALGLDHASLLLGEPAALDRAPDASDPPARLGRPPCSQELPGSTPSTVATEIPSPDLVTAYTPPDPGVRLPAETQPDQRPLHIADTPERPPRARLASWLLV